MSVYVYVRESRVRLGDVGMRVLGRDDVPDKVRTWSVGHGMGE